MSSECPVAEQTDLSHDDSPGTLIDHKGSYDGEETTLPHAPNDEHTKDSLEAAEKIPPVERPVILDDVYPDGGLRAWLVVFGVRALNCVVKSLLISAHRRCVIRSQLSDT
jgi:hypothetical protein